MHIQNPNKGPRFLNQVPTLLLFWDHLAAASWGVATAPCVCEAILGVSTDSTTNPSEKDSYDENP